MIERIFAVSLFIIAAGYTWISNHYVSEISYEPLGARGLPLIIGVFVMVLIVYFFICPSKISYAFDKEKVKRVYILIVYTILYTIFLERIGFLLSTAIIGTAISRFLGQGLRVAFLYDGIGGLVVYLFLVYGLQLNLTKIPLIGF